MRQLMIGQLAGVSGRLTSTSKRVILRNGWETELRERADSARVELFGEPAKGLFRIVKQDTSKYYRVLLRLPALEQGERSIRIAFRGRAVERGVLEWAALLNEASDGGRQFALRERLLSGASPREVVGTISGRLLASYTGPYFVAFQFSTEPGEFFLDQLTIEVGMVGVVPKRTGEARAASPEPHPLFDVAWYLAQLPAPLDEGTNALTHYLLIGEAQGLSPHPLFDPRWYVAQLRERLPEGETALRHYLRVGAAQGASPHPLFDTKWYRGQGSHDRPLPPHEE